MVNAVSSFYAAINTSGAREKAYWEAVRKAGTALEKIGIGELDKLFDSIATTQPLNGGALVFVLAGKGKRTPQDQNNTRRYITQFQFVASNVTAEDLEFIHDKYSAIMSQLSSFLVATGTAIHGITIMETAINAMSRGIPGILTDLHCRLFCMCLSAKRFDRALPYLDLDAGNCFLNVQQSYRVHCENALLFFYYGGLIKLAMKDFNGAAYMFESCVCMPAFAASAIMLESLKKLILLNLILGRPQQLPGFRAPPVQRLSQMKCQKYQAIVQIYNEIIENKNSKNGDVSRLSRHLDRHGTELERDNNAGLAVELCWSAVRNNISKLPEVFSKLQVSKVKKYCRIDDDNICIQHELELFLQREDISGKIDAREGTVSFQPIERCVDMDQQELDNATNNCALLDDLLRRSQRVVDEHCRERTARSTNA